jgi:hypothetical protein
MNLRLRIKQEATFAERLASEARRLKDLASKTAAGPDRDLILRKVSQVETALHIDEWTTSPGLQPPK